jgi:hypothetical protein
MGPTSPRISITGLAEAGLVTAGVLAVADRQVGSEVGSDHYPLLVDLLVGGGR